MSWSTMVLVKWSNKLQYVTIQTKIFWWFTIITDIILLGHLVQNILLIQPLIAFIKDECFVCTSYFHTEFLHSLYQLQQFWSQTICKYVVDLQPVVNMFSAFFSKDWRSHDLTSVRTNYLSILSIQMQFTYSSPQSGFLIHIII